MRSVKLFFLMVLGLSLLLPSSVYTQQLGGGGIDLKRVEVLKEIQKRNENWIMSIPGVVGIGIGLTEDGKRPAFIVYVQRLTSRIKVQAPSNIEGVPVRLYESGIIRAY